MTTATGTGAPVPSTDPEVESAMPHIAWPAVPSPSAARVLSLLFQLDRTQWWSPSELARQQLRQLALIVAHARRTVPFYADRLGALGEGPGPVEAADWDEVPVTTRADAQGAQEALVSSALPEGHGPTFEMATSGSTGRPLRTLGTRMTQLLWCALTLRDHLWHERDFKSTLAVIRQFSEDTRPPPEGAVADSWGPATAGVVRTGPAAMLQIGHTIAEQAGWLSRTGPGYVLTYPSNLAALAEHSLAVGLRLRGLRQARAFGEVLDARARDLCQEAWGVPVVDTYSSQEVGYIALQCPSSTAYHVQSELLLVEILDDEGRPCRPGQTGRVVVSTLHNFATPLLRYEVGDYAEVGEPCPCGRGLPVLTRVLGRRRNMFVLPDGERVWPSLGDARRYRAATAGLPRLRQFQLVQRTVDHVELKLVTERRFTVAEEDVYRRHLREAIGYPFELTFTYLDEIPRTAGGKYEDFRCEVRT